MKLQKTTKGMFLVFPEYEQHVKHPGDQFRILVSKLNEYIHAYEVNYRTYEQRKQNGETGVFTGLKGMTISLDGPYEGVCLFDHYRPVKTKKELEQMIKELHMFVER